MRKKLNIDAVIESPDTYESFIFPDMLKACNGDKANALQIIINQVEGDTSQLSEGLLEYATENGLIDENQNREEVIIL